MKLFSFQTYAMQNTSVISKGSFMISSNIFFLRNIFTVLVWNNSMLWIFVLKRRRKEQLNDFHNVKNILWNLTNSNFFIMLLTILTLGLQNLSLFVNVPLIADYLNQTWKSLANNCRTVLLNFEINKNKFAFTEHFYLKNLTVLKMFWKRILNCFQNIADELL